MDDTIFVTLAHLGANEITLAAAARRELAAGLSARIRRAWKPDSYDLVTWRARRRYLAEEDGVDIFFDVSVLPEPRKLWVFADLIHPLPPSIYRAELLERPEYLEAFPECPTSRQIQALGPLGMTNSAEHWNMLSKSKAAAIRAAIAANPDEYLLAAVRSGCILWAEVARGLGGVVSVVHCLGVISPVVDWLVRARFVTEDDAETLHLAYFAHMAMAPRLPSTHLPTCTFGPTYNLMPGAVQKWTRQYSPRSRI